MSVSVSLVTYRSAEHIDACLAGVRAQGDSVAEVLLVDNGSAGDFAARLAERHRGVDVLALGGNAGYAAAHNRNFARARGDFVLALNPDVVLAEGYLDELLACLRADPRRGAATGRLLTAGKHPRIDSAGITYDPLRTRFVDRGRGAPPGFFARDEDVFGACGAAALYRRSAVDAVSRPGESPFAERFFMYYEDVDLAWRLRRAGFCTRYCPGARAFHERGGSGASAAFVEYHLVRNRLWVSLRNASLGELAAELPGLVCLEVVKLLQAPFRRHLRAALVDQLRGIRASLGERRGWAEA